MPATWNGNQFKQSIHTNAVKMLWKWCLFVAGEAKRLCPVDTGLLMSSIHVVVNELELYGLVGTSVFYAIYVEFGTYKMKAKSFLRAALNIFRQKIGQL